MEFLAKNGRIPCQVADRKRYLEYIVNGKNDDVEEEEEEEEKKEYMKVIKKKNSRNEKEKLEERAKLRCIWSEEKDVKERKVNRPHKKAEELDSCPQYTGCPS
ncbi:hypothetical protein M0802_009203 [Mischocyttarus mexicanus]|nr:hypothetical protein M0802_009203 [Mischocyttarus mexicanus]